MAFLPPSPRLCNVDLGRRLPDHATQLKKKLAPLWAQISTLHIGGEGGIEHDSSPPGMFSLMSSSTRIYSAYDLKPFVFKHPFRRISLFFWPAFQIASGFASAAPPTPVAPEGCRGACRKPFNREGAPRGACESSRPHSDIARNCVICKTCSVCLHASCRILVETVLGTVGTVVETVVETVANL